MLSASCSPQLGTLIMVLGLARGRHQPGSARGRPRWRRTESEEDKEEHVGLECMSERKWSTCLNEAKPTSLSIIMPMPDKRGKKSTRQHGPGEWFGNGMRRAKVHLVLAFETQTHRGERRGRGGACLRLMHRRRVA